MVDVQGSVAWQPASWVTMIQSIASFCAQLVSRSTACMLSNGRLDNMQNHLAQLKEACANFQAKNQQRIAGEQVLSNNLGKLERSDF